MALTDTHVLGAFPSPLEVDRYLYNYVESKVKSQELFPSPLEVDRYLYKDIYLQNKGSSMFPSPLEVDR